MTPPPDHEGFHAILRRYARGEVSAMDAATDIQALGLEGYHDPSASEVVLWARAAGYGGPAPTAAEAEAEARAILERLRERRTE